jgi:hypothetical protein
MNAYHKEGCSSSFPVFLAEGIEKINYNRKSIIEFNEVKEN